MANDKKFIVKNGLQSENNVLIGTTDDDFTNKLQVEGTTKLTSSGSSVPITVENDGGINTPLMNFEGGVGALQVKNSGSGDYSILNTSGANEIKFNDNTANGLVFIAGNNNQLKINTTIADFTNVPSIGGVPVWYAGNDGTGSGLDADLLDGVDSLSFLRSDQDDTFDGNLIITGDLTISGNTTTVNTEEILLADNIIVINSNYAGSAPSENGGIEVERGTLTNSSFLWDETNDYWKLLSAGTDLGRIITTADEGSGNNFDADTVDGLHANQFLRSDVNDTATGNLELEGTVKIGNNTGSALLTMDGVGNNRVLASTAGKIGFLDTAFAYNTYSDANYNWIVGNDVIAKRFLDADNNDYLVNPANTSVLNTLGIDSDLFHNGDTNTKINFGSDTVNIHTNGAVRLAVTDTAVTSSVDVVGPRFVDSGDNDYLVDPAGESVINDVVLAGEIYGTYGGAVKDGSTYIKFANNNTTGLIYFNVDGAGLHTTLSKDQMYVNKKVVAPRFEDSNDNGYYVVPSSVSRLSQIQIDDYIIHKGDTNTYFGFDTDDSYKLYINGVQQLAMSANSAVFNETILAPDIGIDSDLFHNGDTNTKLGFTADTIALTTGGSARLTVNNTSVTASVNVIAPQVGIDSDIFHNGNSGTKLSFGTNTIDLNTNGVSRAALSDSLLALTVPVSIKTASTFGGNPFAVTNKLLAFGDANSDDFSIRGDLSGNSYNVMDRDGDFYVTDSGANFALSVITGTSEVVIGAQTTTYTQGDHTPVLAAGVKTNNKLHIEGSLQLNGANDAYVVGNGTATFLRMDELGFGSGGGFYMSNTATVRMRGNKNLLTSGTMFASRYYDNDDTTYYGDFANTSVINDISLEGEIIHKGDQNTKIGFADDQIIFTAGATEQLNVYPTYAKTTTDMRSPIFSDAGGTFKFEPNTTAAHRFTTPTGWLEIGSKVAATSQFDTDRAKFLFNKRVDFNGGISAADANDMAYFPTYYDFDNNDYYGNFAGTSVMNQIDIEDYIRHKGDTTTYMGFSDDATYKVFISGVQRLNIDANSADFSSDVYAPRYYDAGNNAFYLDPASTSITNVIRVQEIQVGTGSTTIEPPSGPKGTIMVEGERDSYAGYMISNDWGFISSGATEMGLYNETDNEWSLVANRNNFTRLYSNNIHQIGAENGYGSAPNSMRSPIFYDLDDAAFFADLAGQNRLKSIKAGDGAINNNTLYPIEVKSAQKLMIRMVNSAADPNYPSLFHETRNTRSTFGINFNGVADRFWFAENGDFQAYGAGIFGSLALNGGNEDLGLLKTYGSGLADLKMFDASDYWDKRVIQPMQGLEDNATATTAEYVKNGDGPFASSYALRTAGYRDFQSDFIAVEPGEDIYVEQAARLISGTGGFFYLGVARYDKDKNPIATNDGIVYFGASAVDVTSTSWTQYKGTHTLPTSHTVFNGSDGLGVRYIRVVSLMNYSAGGATREFGPPIAKRTNVQSDLRTPNMLVEVDLTVENDAFITGDLTVNDIFANVVDVNRLRDAGNTAYYIEPLTGAKVAGSWDWTNGSINNLNSLSFNDPGPTEGIKWNGGNQWQIYESPDDLATNSGGNLQITSGINNGVKRLTITPQGDVQAGRYMDAARFRDSANAAYYADPAATSVLNQIYVDEYIRHNGDTDTHLRFRGDDDMSLVAGGTQMIRMTQGTALQDDRLRFVTDDNWTDSNGDWAMSRNVIVTGTHTALNGSYASRFYDSDDNAYYLDPASISITNTVRANAVQFGGATYQLDATTGGYGSISVTGNKNGYAGYAINDDWVFMSSGAGVAGIYNDTNDEWAQIWRQNGDVELYWDGVEQASTKNGFFLGTNEVRSPIFRDSDNSTYFGDFGGTSRFLGLTVDQVITGSVSGSSGQLRSKENLVISPSEDNPETMAFGLGTWNNDGASPYADYIHLKSGNDAADGSDNLLMFKKSGGRGMRLYSGSFGSTTAYSSYSDLAIYNANPGGGTSSQFYASKFIDSDDTSFFIDPSSISKIKHLEVAGENLNASYSHAALEVREYNYGGSQTDNNATAPRIGFHWGGRVASQIRLASNGEIQIRDNPGTGYEDFRADNIYAQGGAYAGTFYDRDDAAYYGNFAGTSIVNILDVRGEIYNDGMYRNDTSGKGLYNTATTQYFYSDGDDGWNIAGGSAANWLRFRDENAGTIRGYVYSNNSNDIGFRNQSNSWALRTNGGTTEVYGDLYANAFYDRNNSAFFVNPAADSVFSGDIRANRFVNKNAVSDNNSFGLYFATNESSSYAIYREAGGWSNPYPDLRIAFHTGISMGAYHGYNGIRFFNDATSTTQVMSINNGSDPLGQNDVYVNNSLQAGGSLRAPIFYDSNDTNRYTNPASTSQMSTIEWDQLNARDMGDYITLYGNNNADHSISSRNASGNAADDIRINSYGSIFFNLDSNNNNTSGADFRVGRHGGTGTINNTDLFRVYGDANYAYSGFSFRAPIFYDSNDTNFYCDPSSASNFNTSVRANEVYARNWFRNDNSGEGLYNQNTGIHAYSYQNAYFAIAGNSNSSISLQLRSSYNSSVRMWLHGDTSNWCGYLNTGGQWQIRTRMQDGYSPNHWYYEDANTSWTGNPGNDKGKIEYHSDRFYIAAGGNSNRICQFRRDGSDKSYVDNNGLYVGTATSARWADLAERYTADAVYPHGTVLAIDIYGDKEVTKYEPGMPLAGCVSTLPAVMMNDMGYDPDDKSDDALSNPFVALKGRIPVLINGTAKKGQWIIADKDGKGRAVDYGTDGINTHEIIGFAISNCDGNGEVEVKV